MGEGASKLIILVSSYGCCSLRTGAKYVAISVLISSVLNILFVTVTLTLPDETKYMKISRTLMYYSLAAALLSFVGALILLIGIQQYRHWLFIPYLILSPISMILNLMALAKSVPEVPIYVVVPLGMLTMLEVYNWFIVLSHFGELIDGEEYYTDSDTE